MESSPRRSRLKLWLIIVISAAPMIASYLAYYVWQPSGHVNYGELLEPRPMTASPLPTLDGGAAFSFSDVKGAWVLLMADSARCGERCEMSLLYMRQVRLAQGKESERIERVWLLTDDGRPAPALLQAHPGLHVVRGRGSDALGLLSTPADSRIHVVDPLGNLMMRFPPDPDPRRILRDLARLLRHSKWK